jgi:hypothetical protein
MALILALIMANVSLETVIVPPMICATSSPMRSRAHVFWVSSRAIRPSSMI